MKKLIITILILLFIPLIMQAKNFNDIQFSFMEMDEGLTGGYIAGTNKIIFSTNIIKETPLIFQFIIFHEIGHFLTDNQNLSKFKIKESCLTDKNYLNLVRKGNTIESICQKEYVADQFANLIMFPSLRTIKVGDIDYKSDWEFFRNLIINNN